MRVPSYLKGRYRDLIKQLRELAAAKKRGPREYKELNKHTRLRWRGGSVTITKQ